jgi:hypothetical protein
LKIFYWEETLYSVLTWYEQAMQDKAWQIIANALGTLLETLSYIILVLDESNPVTKAEHDLLFQQKANKKDREKRWNTGNKPGQERSPTELRLKVVLKRIGLTSQRGHNDVNDVHEFYGIRNDATHPTATGQGQNRRDELLNQARMWVDEILLWRLGYNGIYTNRCQNQDLTGPRYDLSSRDPNW